MVQKPATEALQRSAVDAVEALARRFELPRGALERLLVVVRALVVEPVAPTSVRTAAEAIDQHLADSLVALELEPVRKARKAVDLGSGAGFPGLPLAIACPRAAFELLESSRRKCQFIESVVERCALENVSVVCRRAEMHEAGLRTYDLATARAVAPLDVVLEYAAPLLAVGGRFVAWRGRRDPTAEGIAARAATELGMQIDEVVRVKPFRQAAHRYLHLYSKVVETPPRFPRRPGVAAKRRLGRRGG